MSKAADTRKKRASYFRDTLEYFKESKTLSDALRWSLENNRFYDHGEYPEISREKHEDGQISVSTERSVRAALRLHKENPGKKIVIMNLASALKPGGTVTESEVYDTQEVSLCLSTTLFPVLDDPGMREVYYKANAKDADGIYADRVIYTPGVVICKTDKVNLQRLSEDEFCMVDVVSCAAPDMQGLDLPEEKLSEIIRDRFRHVLHICAANGADIVIASAWGCGACGCDPVIVSRAMLAASEEYLGYFDRIEYAVKCSNNPSWNHIVFAGEIGMMNGWRDTVSLWLSDIDITLCARNTGTVNRMIWKLCPLNPLNERGFMRYPAYRICADMEMIGSKGTAVIRTVLYGEGEPVEASLLDFYQFEYDRTHDENHTIDRALKNTPVVEHKFDFTIRGNYVEPEKLEAALIKAGAVIDRKSPVESDDPRVDFYEIDAHMPRGKFPEKLLTKMRTYGNLDFSVSMSGRRARFESLLVVLKEYVAAENDEWDIGFNGFIL